jgi:DNA polymerase delta subunit 1
MSPTKRAASLVEDGINVPEKRLRGGGGGDDAPPEDFFPDEDEYLDEIIESPIVTGDSKNSSLVALVETDEAMLQPWVRPPISIKDNKEDLSLQWLDMDMTAGVPLSYNPNKNNDRVVGSTTGQVPVIRVYGVSETGNSVSVFIHGFTPYGYFALPPNSTFQNTEENLTKIRHCINTQLEVAARNARLPEYCRAVSYVTSHRSIMGYDAPEIHFFKVMVAMPTLIPALKRMMEEGMDLPGVSTPNGNKVYSAFECNVPFVLRYMIDRDISGAGWLTLPATTYQLREESEKRTHCQVRDTRKTVLYMFRYSATTFL